MKKSIAIISMLACFLVGCGLTLLLTRLLPANVRTNADTQTPAVLQKAQEVYEVLDTCYIGDMDETLMGDCVADALVYGTGDRWSYYISAEDYDAHMETMNNAYVGIGVAVQQTQDGQLVVTEVTPNGPADIAGVQPDDVFSEVDGVDCSTLCLSDLRKLVRGEVGSRIEVIFLRDGKEIEISMVRKNVETEVVRYALLDDVGYIAIYNFDATAGEKTIAAIQDLQLQGAKSLLFDVRYNPGGLKTEMLAVLDYLLPEGPLFRSQDYLGHVDVDQSDADCVELPMAVLINQDSYSAAEFFAAALSEYGVAKTVGSKTCGKGYFQVTIPLSDGSAINLSTGEYYTPNGISLAEVGGLVPDVALDLTEADEKLLIAHRLNPAEDAQLQKALLILE